MSDLPDKIARLIQGLLDAAQEDDGKKLWGPKTMGTREALEAAIEDALDSAYDAAGSERAALRSERDEARAAVERLTGELTRFSNQYRVENFLALRSEVARLTEALRGAETLLSEKFGPRPSPGSIAGLVLGTLRSALSSSPGANTNNATKEE